MSESNRIAPTFFQMGLNHRPELSRFALILGDIVAFVLSGLLALGLSFSVDTRGPATLADWLATQSTARYLAWVLIAGIGIVLFFGRFQHYRDRKPFWTELSEVLQNLAWLALLDIALTSVARWNSSRLWWVLVWLLVSLLIPIIRVLVRKVLSNIGWWQRPTVLIGSGPNALDAMLALRSEPTLGFEIVGCVEVHHGLFPPSVHSYQAVLPPILTPEEVREVVQQFDLQVVVAMEHNQSAQREHWLRQLARWKVQDVYVIPAMRGVPLFGTDISWFYSHEVALLRVRNNLRRWPARLTKRVFDVVASATLLLLLAPLMAYLAVRVQQDGGPSIYAHQRIGRGGKPFPCFKFRSMVVDASSRLEELLASDTELRAQWELDHKLKYDPRISSLGHFLRKTSLDELPQLFNVLRGEMSLVGPRPIVTAELEKYGDDAEYFSMVRPGITGLWQVSGRNDVDYDRRVYLDTWYVKNWSLWYDIAILFKTVRVVFRREGAY
jgi:Undecaprenyl-phosphate galactose phosphotransferase WbaP